jgi:hypothetical protein
VTRGYASGREHLFDELRRLDLLLNLQVARQRRDPAFANFDQFRGVFISDAEIDRLVERGSGHRPAAPSKADEGLTRSIAGLVQEISGRAAEAMRAGVRLPLSELAAMFGLPSFDVDVLLICLAPELDLKYEMLYAYLQNDAARRWPSVDLALTLLCNTLDERLAGRSRLSRTAPLVSHGLVAWSDDDEGSSLARPLRIDPRILDFLLERGGLDEEITAFARLVEPGDGPTETLLPDPFMAELMRAAATRAGEAPLIWLWGPPGAGRKHTAHAVCRAAGRRLLVAGLPAALAAGGARAVRRVVREARLQDAVLYLDGCEVLCDEDERGAAARRDTFAALAGHRGAVFAGSERPWRGGRAPGEPAVLKVRLSVPPYADRRRLLERFVTDQGQSPAGLDLDGAADRFCLTPGKYREVVAEARAEAALRAGPGAPITNEDLYAACRGQSASRLTELARKVTPLFKWDDIVLPADNLAQLREMCAQARYHHQVFDAWGFSGRLALGRGLSALFIGPSGTGKTMAAEIIARELGLDMYQIDLANMVSKYIGETEKNLSRVFREAQQSSVILFFDEADALFGKRSEVHDSHDRYANIEINYLLQQMEEYEGIAILASNFHRNIDEAFMRRLRFIIEFPTPNETYRERLWRTVYPPDTPLSKDINYGFLARKFQLTGGSIKNIALGSAFLAARDGGKVSMDHIVLAIKREFQKSGRACVRSDFEQYYDLVAGDVGAG